MTQFFIIHLAFFIQSTLNWVEKFLEKSLKVGIDTAVWVTYLAPCTVSLTGHSVSNGCGTVMMIQIPAILVPGFVEVACFEARNRSVLQASADVQRVIV